MRLSWIIVAFCLASGLAQLNVWMFGQTTTGFVITMVEIAGIIPFVYAAVFHKPKEEEEDDG